MNTFKIEKNIKIPPRALPHTIFPLNEMEIGDSFFVHIRDFKVNGVNTLRSRVYTRINKFLKEADIEGTCFRIHAEREKKGVRVFKVKRNNPD